MQFEWVKDKKCHTLYEVGNRLRYVKQRDFWLSSNTLNLGTVKKSKNFAVGNALIKYRVKDSNNKLLAVFNDLETAKKFLETVVKLTN